MRTTRTEDCGKPTACRALRRRPGAFRGGGHDPSESRMRENRTSGLTGGDGETWPRWGMGHRTGAKAAGQQPLPAPTAGRVSPRLYDSLLCSTTESIAATWPDVNMLIRRNRDLQPRGCTLELKGRELSTGMSTGNPSGRKPARRASRKAEPVFPARGFPGPGFQAVAGPRSSQPRRSRSGVFARTRAFA